MFGPRRRRITSTCHPFVKEYGRPCPPLLFPGEGGGEPKRRNGYVGWYFRVYVRVRLLRRESSTRGWGGGLSRHQVGGGGGGGHTYTQCSRCRPGPHPLHFLSHYGNPPRHTTRVPTYSSHPPRRGGVNPLECFGTFGLPLKKSMEL